MAGVLGKDASLIRTEDSPKTYKLVMDKTIKPADMTKLSNQQT